MKEKIISLRMERQGFVGKNGEAEYDELYRDLQPGMNVYWNGFGQPPTLSFRTEFDDIEYNRQRQLRRALVKGRFAGGNLGWIVPEDLELFMALYRKPLKDMTDDQRIIYDLIIQQGPSSIQRIKEETGLLVKRITPALHRLQEAFLLYEDQYDGEWDRGWYRFEEMFPEADPDRYTRQEALRAVLVRFARRTVCFTAEMAKSFYRLPAKDIMAALDGLVNDGTLIETDGGYLRAEDVKLLDGDQPQPMHFVCAVHRNDFLYRAMEAELKARFAPMCEGLSYDHELLQYLLIDGEFKGAVIGHFRNGPYDLNDVIGELPAERMEEIIEAVQAVNYGKRPERFLGKRI